MNPFDIVERKLAGYPLARDNMLALMRKGRQACAGRDGRTKTEHIQESLAQLWRRHPKKTKILYLVHYPLPNIIRQSLALRQTGRYVTALIGVCNREELRLEQYFDAHFECGSAWELARILPTLRADVIQAVNGPSVIPCLAVLFSEVPVVTEVYDSIVFYWDDIEARPEYQMERFSLEHSQGVLHKYPREGHVLLQNHYTLDVPLLQFHAYVVDEFTPNEVQNGSRNDVPKVVYTGGVMPPERAHELGHTNHIFFDIIRQITNQGIRLTIYANQNAKNMRWHRQKPYFDIQSKSPLFEFRSGIPIDRVAFFGRYHDFGLFYDNLTLHRFSSKHFRFMTATKFFSYLEMGLPVLVYPESEFLSMLVEKHGIGIKYDAREPVDLKRTLLECDYDTLRKNVATLRNVANIKNYVSTLQRFHTCVLKSEKQPPSFDRFFPLENE